MAEAIRTVFASDDQDVRIHGRAQRCHQRVFVQAGGLS
jgi:hypothetical protein